MPVRLLTLLLAAVLAAVLAGCGGAATTGTVEWRDLDVTLPQGWEVYESRTDLLAASDGGFADLQEVGSLPDQPTDPDDNDVVAFQFTRDAGATADDWRALVAQAGGTLEADESITVGGVPATSLTFSWVTNQVPTRERVVLVPSRELVLLFQPVPVQGQTTGPQVYLEKADQFEAVLDSIRFGAPLD